MEIGKKKDGLGYLIKWIIRLGDVISINLGLILLYHLVPIAIASQSQLGEILLLINLTYFITINLIPLRFLEEHIVFFDKIIQKSLTFITLYYILLSAGVFLFEIGKLEFTDWLLYYVGIAIIYLFWHSVARSALKWYRRKGHNYKRIIIAGNGNGAIGIYHELKSSVYGYKILGQFGDKALSECDDLEYLGRISDIQQFCLNNKVDEIYCTLPNNEETEIIQMVNLAERNMIRFFLIPDFYGYIKRKLVLHSLQSIPVIAIRPEPLQKLYNRILKRSFDIIFSLLVIVSIFPIVYIIFGLLIKLTSKGSILFRQQRTGLHGKVFTCYKFRTMVSNQQDKEKITERQDSRITKIGAFMRRTSIDELPQFFNTLIGDMSVVGPRPHMIQQTDLYNQLIDKFMVRHLIKPGITGWAQISGYRGETRTIEQMESRFKKDVWYLENWSFALDLKIIAVTAYQVIKGDENAY